MLASCLNTCVQHLLKPSPFGFPERHSRRPKKIGGRNGSGVLLVSLANPKSSLVLSRERLTVLEMNRKGVPLKETTRDCLGSFQFSFPAYRTSNKGHQTRPAPRPFPRPRLVPGGAVVATAGAHCPALSQGLRGDVAQDLEIRWLPC